MFTLIEKLSSWLQNTAPHHRWHIASTAVLSAFTGAGILLVYQSWAHGERVRSLKANIPKLPRNPIINKQTATGTSPEPKSSVESKEHQHTSYTSKEDERSTQLAVRARQGDYDDDLILEQLARNRVFFKNEGLSKLRSSFIVIVGCGGVGSHAAAALARSGVARLRLIDFDQVTLSSLNRHSLATLADVGTPKVECIRKRLEQITPWVHFDCRNELFSRQVASQQLQAWDGQTPDFVVDAIDNIESKVDLLHFCHQKGLRVVSSMGAGCKSDPTRILIGDISATIEDPLSKATRRRLKLLGVTTGIPVVYSSEKSAPEKAQLMPLPEEEFAKGDVKDLSVMRDFRIRILPVLGTMPAMFGLCVANHIMLELGEYPHEYLPTKYREKMYDAVLAATQGMEERFARWTGDDGKGLRIPLTVDDVAYLVEDIYRGRSVLSGLSTRLVLIRWHLQLDDITIVDNTVDGQKASTLSLSNLVCMTKEEAARHEKDILATGKDPRDFYSFDIVKQIQNRISEIQQYEKYR